MLGLPRELTKGVKDILLAQSHRLLDGLAFDQAGGHTSTGTRGAASVGDKGYLVHPPVPDGQPELHGVPTGPGEASVTLESREWSMISWVHRMLPRQRGKTFKMRAFVDVVSHPYVSLLTDQTHARPDGYPRHTGPRSPPPLAPASGRGSPRGRTGCDRPPSPPPAAPFPRSARSFPG